MKCIAILATTCVLGLLPRAGSAQELPASIERLPTTVYLPGTTQSGPDNPQATGPVAIQDIEVLTQKANAPYKGVKSRFGTKSATQKFLEANAAVLGIDDSASEFKVVESRETLTGTYVGVEQRVNGLRVLDGSIEINFLDDGSLQSVTRNVVAVPKSKAGEVQASAKLPPAAAQERVWQDLGGGGELLEKPSVEKIYVSEGAGLKLAYLVRMAVSEPLGYWEYVVDASSGEIVSRRDRRIIEEKFVPAAETPRPAEKRAPASLNEALAGFESSEKALARTVRAAKSGTPIDTTGVVFVPNPISTLGDSTLRDHDPPSRFTAAYETAQLRGLTKVADRFTLAGEDVRILDFERGDGMQNRAPSTVPDRWTATRGDNAFNDVMTYFHIHNELQYLRTLGFAGDKELFPAGIDVDSDGVNGDDNSHYVPGSDRIAFGHGCVDDNEDTDVILHEFGHALHHHLNSQWRGGDSDAIGEGFGDYWAYSRRTRMKNGTNVDAGKVFVWDGISQCWPGRRVDRNDARYNPMLRYGAHKPIQGFVSDEIWSTPLVNSLKELVARGEAPESVDTAVLAGMQVAGSGFTMRTLARITVDQARRLYPGRPHAEVLERHFKAVHILE